MHCQAISPGPHFQSMESILEQFNETLDEKQLLVKILLRIQRTYEERELLLRRYLSQEDIEQLISERNPVKGTATVSAKYFHAVCGHNLRSFSASHFRVGRLLMVHRLPADHD